MINILIGGLLVGALYALFNLGIVVAYRQSGVINFAHGAVGTVAAVVAYEIIGAGMPWWIAYIAAVASGGIVEGLIEFLVVRHMPWAKEWNGAVSAVGVALLLVGLVSAIWGNNPQVLPQPVPQRAAIVLGGAHITGEELLVLGLAVVVTLGLVLLVGKTKFGLMVRAASEGPLTAGMLGVPVERIRTASWGIAGALGGLAAVLITPEYQLDPTTLTIFSIGAFSGVVLGGLESLGGALLGSLTVGVVFTYITYSVGSTWIYPVSLVVVMVVLLVRPYGIFGRRLKRIPEAELPAAIAGIQWFSGLGKWATAIISRISAAVYVVVAIPRPLRTALRHRILMRGLLLGAAAVTIAVPPLVLGSSPIFDLALVAAMYPAVVGQKVILGDSGQISVGTSGFMVVGGYVFTEIILRWEINAIVALLCAMVSGALVGVLLNVVGGRLEGGYLALVTLMFALAVPQAAGALGKTTGSFSGLQLPPIHLAGLTLVLAPSMYMSSVVVALIVAAVGGWLMNGATGRSWHAVRDSEVGAVSCGMSVPRVKAGAFAVGGAFAGLAGAMTAILVAFMSPDSYTFWNSIYLLAAVVVGGQASLLGALVGTALIVLVPIASAGSGGYPDVIFGAVIVAIMLISPTGFITFKRRANSDGAVTAVGGIGGTQDGVRSGDLVSRGGMIGNASKAT